MRKYRIVFDRKALIDIDEVIEFIINQYKAPITAKRYQSDLFKKIESLQTMAESFPISTNKSIQTLARNARRINFKKFAIIYTVEGRTVIVRRIIASSLIL